MTAKLDPRTRLASRPAARSRQPAGRGQPHNLPTELTSFVGREREIAEVKRLLSMSRLVTLTGAGGIGKTRLALRVAADLLEACPDGLWLVELASLSEPSLVPQTLAAALGLREHPARPLPATLADYLRARQSLLVLDNCEHLVSACAALAESLLRTCPKLRVMVTSREALDIAGEAIWRVPALPMPFFTRLPPVERLTQYEAISLFVDRARGVLPDFAVTEANAPAVAQICHRLDGIPLAIELAAARVKVLSPEQIVARLDDRFSLLTGGSRTASPRYRTLRALIDWSHDLLSEPERILWRRLSVFTGGWTLEAAEAVAGGSSPTPIPQPLSPGEVLDLIEALVDKSLVLVEKRAGAARYSLLETLREYGARRLRESGEEAALRERHRDWALGFAERSAALLNGPRQAEAFDSLEQEHDNLRAALDWCRSETGGWEAGSRIAHALSWFWVLRGYRREGKEWTEQLLGQAPEGTAARAKLLLAAGLIVNWDVDTAASAAYLEEALRLWQRLGDRRGIAVAIGRLGQLRKAVGDYDGAWELLQGSSTLFKELEGGEPDPAVPLALSLAQVAKERGDYERAEPLFEECLAFSRERGDPHSVASALRSLGELRQLRGAYEQAGELFRESLALLRELDDKPCTATALEQLGHLAMAQGWAERAARLLAAARSLEDEAIGFGVVTARRAAVESALAAARTALGEAAFDAAWSEGQEMEYHQAVEYALGGLTRDPVRLRPTPKQAPLAGRSDPLTAREREVAALIARGLMNRQIGAELVITERTVETHVANILSKLGLTSRTQIATWAVAQGLLAANPR